MYCIDRDWTIDFMTSKGNAQHSAALRMSAPATALVDGENGDNAVEWGGDGGDNTVEWGGDGGDVSAGMLKGKMV